MCNLRDELGQKRLESPATQLSTSGLRLRHITNLWQSPEHYLCGVLDRVSCPGFAVDASGGTRDALGESNRRMSFFPAAPYNFDRRERARQSIRSNQAIYPALRGQMGETLEEAIDEHLERVDWTVDNLKDALPGDASIFANWKTVARRAKATMLDVVNAFGNELGQFTGLMNAPGTANPQFIAAFRRSDEQAMVVKAYGESHRGEGQVGWLLTERSRLRGTPNPSVNVLRIGEHPGSWLIMEHAGGHSLSKELTLPGKPTTRDIAEHRATLFGRTRELGVIMRAVHRVSSRFLQEAPSLHDEWMPHLKGTMRVLIDHGYAVLPNWEQLATQAFRTGKPVPLHTDLFPGNLQVDDYGNLRALDIAARRGDSAFDAARWLVRTHNPCDIEEGLANFVEGYGRRLDPATVEAMLFVEYLKQASTREFDKEKYGRPWGRGNDAETLALLDKAHEHLDMWLTLSSTFHRPRNSRYVSMSTAVPTTAGRSPILDTL